MRIIKVAVSKEPPRIKECLWAKPSENGFILYLQNNGAWIPLSIATSNGTLTTIDDIVYSMDAINTVIDSKADLLTVTGESGDGPNVLTLNGIRNRFDGKCETITGDPYGTIDDGSDVSLYGLKRYIDARLAALD